ncbi:MAG: HypC/HybG/HupF family hydrogenase formation chaperone [Sedimenticola sp.]|jgi:hydrogenase expression/formation protein HypC|uniref:HypC/HybG/HupF family hydrogenase formation chaperone n=1 Tax=Sedimenticola thiotaurini TaxID=1543721 RepID=A0A558CWB2_9GAMM|nr:HypC/HybG/HupF family hydrogenase formation chaperone [Sedimenticola sp.]MCW8976465.1 HypC/HybG/HupF family hydrogenase formation chaperone [Sedimenticola sp.]MDF1528465.1 HypC/HybG/HupF family hydrogenase formation chaperone [Sedimenticola sp.]TVT53032.1 MAG: HypC/HybG/HupF family hydrogenase formation chaperone [Sedimenticola thiotaurini]
MCLAIPGKVVAIDEAADMATVSVGNVKKDVSIALVEDVGLGDYLLIHVGYALNKISEEEAAITLRMFEEAGLSESVL